MGACLVIVAIIATLGSWGINWYAIIKGEKILTQWHLTNSANYRKAVTVLYKDQHVILKSRVGRFAAICGHVNIAYALEKPFDDPEIFLIESALGHLLWTLQYAAFGFVIGWLLPYAGRLLS